MTFFRRLLYLFYYLRTQDWQRLHQFVGYARDKYGKSAFSLWMDAIGSVFRYNVSLEEYFLFRFFIISKLERETYAGTGYMYEYQKRMNPTEFREVLADKSIFLKNYGRYVRHSWASIKELHTSPDEVLARFSGNGSKLVLKHSRGQCGRGVKVIDNRDDASTLIHDLERSGNDLIEAFVVQHQDLMRLSPSGLNTVRIITQLDKHDEVHILGARLRITVNSVVDNLAAGNLAAPIDLESGVVNGPGVYSDISKSDVSTHPVTGVEIVGFQIPFWDETLAMCRSAALHDIRNRSIGWDVAITDEGPELIEGNHDWCKLLWQLPVKEGLKPVLDRYMEELKSLPS